MMRDLAPRFMCDASERHMLEMRTWRRFRPGGGSPCFPIEYIVVLEVVVLVGVLLHVRLVRRATQ